MKNEEINRQIAEKIFDWQEIDNKLFPPENRKWDTNPDCYQSQFCILGGDCDPHCEEWEERKNAGKIPPKFSVWANYAFMIIEKMTKDQESNFYEWTFELSNNYIGCIWHAKFELTRFDNSPRFEGEADTPEMAICLAALKAVEAYE